MSPGVAGTPAERIVLALRGAAKQGQPALVAFLTAGMSCNSSSIQVSVTPSRNAPSLER